ncbi:MAG: biotin--[acetyl-CoA-carboxylase] ligase [Firmicutes bacterium HGW-Firmicutes-15]|nr:MAG: biotin--[acetyl-CoA-carboxylase] ligase [Firmicutes bacterium HGW-Firmicutes-15]
MQMPIHGETSLPHKHLKLLGKDIYLYREISSTNTVARLVALSGAPEGTIVMSKSQTAGKGRGRMNRQWVCPPGKGLLMSMVLRPEIRVQFVPQLTLLCAVVVAETIKKVTGCAAGIKWPNDILIGGKKVCGILAESNFSNGSPEYVIIGIGINVNLDQPDLPADRLDTSTSLKLELGQRVSRLTVLKQFICTWDQHYQGFLEGGQGYLRHHWIQNNVILGRNVTINKENDSISGQAIDISENGGLIVRLADGNIQEFLAEDISIGSNYFGSNT